MNTSTLPTLNGCILICSPVHIPEYVDRVSGTFKVLKHVRGFEYEEARLNDAGKATPWCFEQRAAAVRHAKRKGCFVWHNGQLFRPV